MSVLQKLHSDDVFLNDKAILAIIGYVAAVAIAITLASFGVNPFIIMMPLVFSAVFYSCADKNLNHSEQSISEWADNMHRALPADADAVFLFLQSYKAEHDIDDCHALQLVDQLEILSLTTEQKQGVQRFRETMPSFPPHYRLHSQIKKIRQTLLKLTLNFVEQINALNKSASEY